LLFSHRTVTTQFAVLRNGRTLSTAIKQKEKNMLIANGLKLIT